MADTAHPTVALLAIHPRFANAILEETKRVEFRKVAFRRPVTHVVMYATSPIQRIVGIFEVLGTEWASPHVLWRRFGDVAGLERAEFLAYYRSNAKGVAMRIGAVHRLDVALALSRVHRPANVPQSFRYLDGAVLGRLGMPASSHLTGGHT